MRSGWAGSAEKIFARWIIYIWRQFRAVVSISWLWFAFEAVKIIRKHIFDGKNVCFDKIHQKSSKTDWKIHFLVFFGFFICFLYKFVEKMKNLHFLDYPRSCLDLASILPRFCLLPRSCLDLTSILPRSCLGRLCIRSSKWNFMKKHVISSNISHFCLEIVKKCKFSLEFFK